MRRMIRWLLLLGVGALLLPFFTLGPGGAPLLNWRAPTAPALPALPALPSGASLPALDDARQWMAQLGAGAGDSAPQQAVAPNGDEREGAGGGLYKWQDQRGQWHFTDHPPAAGVPYQRLGSSVTVMPATQPAPPSPRTRDAAPAGGGSSPVPGSAPPSPGASAAQGTALGGGQWLEEGRMPSLEEVYNPANVERMMRDARSVERLLQERKKAMDQVIDAGQ